MTDLAILVPSRGRPSNVARLADACAQTCRTRYVLHFGFDDDDPRLHDNRTVAGRHVTTGPRMGLVAWTNHLASLYANRPPPYLASLGDDMVPITDGWDEQLITELEHVGAGCAYPDDKRRNDIPEGFIISQPIVAALGWMMMPALDHWYPDNVLADICKPNGCLVFCPDVLVEHRHPNVDHRASGDQTYHDAARKFNADAAAYRKWRLYQMAKDIETVRQVKEACSDHP